MTEALIFDSIRTPRGKGKADGRLHEVKPVDLLAGLLAQLQQRTGLDTAAVDDVVMGVVSPVGEQGSVRWFRNAWPRKQWRHRLFLWTNRRRWRRRRKRHRSKL